MAEVQRESSRLHRLIGRGRDDSTPFYLGVAVLSGSALAAYELS